MPTFYIKRKGLSKDPIRSFYGRKMCIANINKKVQVETRTVFFLVLFLK